MWVKRDSIQKELSAKISHGDATNTGGGEAGGPGAGGREAQWLSALAVCPKLMVLTPSTQC